MVSSPLLATDYFLKFAVIDPQPTLKHAPDGGRKTAATAERKCVSGQRVALLPSA